MQNWGLRDGLPGTAYNAGVKAKAFIEETLVQRIDEALAEQRVLRNSNTVVACMLKVLEEEGLRIEDQGQRCGPAPSAVRADLHAMHACACPAPDALLC
jgi:hypothetical protein